MTAWWAIYSASTTGKEALGDDIPQLDGSHVWGCCIFKDHQIKMSKQASASRVRLVVLIHELYHAWRATFGPTQAGEEGEADWFAHVSSEVMLQIFEQPEATANVLGCPLDELTRTRSPR